MPIIGYEENLTHEVYYIVVNEIEGEEVTEKISAEQLLATRPILVELYEYKNDVTIESRVECRVEKIEPFPKQMQMMIIDYFECHHSNVAMQLVENIFGLGKKPPFSLLLTLVNIILQPKELLTKKEEQKEHWLQCKRAHAILMDVLSLYGPEIYHPMWNQFKYFKLISAQKAKGEKDEEYSQLDSKELESYSDFWEYTEKLLNHGTTNLDSKCRRLILDFFVNILQIDLKARVDKEKRIRFSVFYKTIKVQNIKHYLKILFKKFPSNDENLLYLTGDLLNMFITVSCFEKSDIVNIVYSKFREMDAESCQLLMQVIKYPTFIIEICDKALADTNITNVEEPYLYFRHTQHIPLYLEKVLFYVFKTLPMSDSLKDIYRHVSIVSKYTKCVFSTASINHKRVSDATNSALPKDQLEMLINTKDQVLYDWETMLEQLMHGNNSNYNLEIIEKIRWAVKLTRLTITEYI